MNMITLYGIKNCDTVKKARLWMDEHNIQYRFHDIRTDGLKQDTLDKWLQSAGWETVLNKRGTTWRKLELKAQQQVNENNVSSLLLEHPTMIKRPVLDVDGIITIGFKPDNYSDLFNS
jgi:Spx/MgsR family transcriptional regulator